jgi:hypothetical protein
MLNHLRRDHPELRGLLEKDREEEQRNRYKRLGQVRLG